MTIDAKGSHYKLLNEKIRQSILDRVHDIVLENVNGQRYIGDGLTSNARIIIKGIPGNDLGAFMNGPTLDIRGNGQDGIGNTMNDGKILVHGHAVDIVGYAMRGGKIFIEGDVGYRVGIHMKAYEGFYPVIIAGGSAQDFLGEYMAGGLIIVLGMNADPKSPIVGNYCGTGMHAGIIYIRGEIKDYQLGKEVKVFPLNEEDHRTLKTYVDEFAHDFSYDPMEILDKPFYKLIPYTHRPYGKLYAY